MKYRLFWISFGIDVLTCVIVLIFFFIGLADGSVSLSNIEIWTAILAVLAVIIFGSLGLKKHGHSVKGTILLLVLAVPALIFGLFVLLFVVTDTKWV